MVVSGQAPESEDEHGGTSHEDGCENGVSKRDWSGRVTTHKVAIPPCRARRDAADQSRPYGGDNQDPIKGLAS